MNYISNETMNQNNLNNYIQQYEWIKTQFEKQNNQKTTLHLTEFVTYVFLSLNGKQGNNNEICLNGISKNWLFLFKYLMEYNLYNCHETDYDISKNSDGSLNAKYSLNSSYLCETNFQILNMEIANKQNEITTNNTNSFISLTKQIIVNMKTSNALNYIYIMQYDKKHKNKWAIKPLTDDILSINDI